MSGALVAKLAIAMLDVRHEPVADLHISMFRQVISSLAARDDRGLRTRMEDPSFAARVAEWRPGPAPGTGWDFERPMRVDVPYWAEGTGGAA